MTLHHHQHLALVAELRRPEYDSMDPEAAFAAFGHATNEPAPPCLKRLAATRFLTRYQLNRLPAKMRPAPDRMVLVSEEESRGFRSGLPGFPNKVRREWFDVAWQEARG